MNNAENHALHFHIFGCLRGTGVPTQVLKTSVLCSKLPLFLTPLFSMCGEFFRWSLGGVDEKGIFFDTDLVIEKVY